MILLYKTCLSIYISQLHILVNDLVQILTFCKVWWLLDIRPKKQKVCLPFCPENWEGRLVNLFFFPFKKKIRMQKKYIIIHVCEFLGMQSLRNGLFGSTKYSQVILQIS